MIVLLLLLQLAVVDSATKYLYVREITENRSPEIDRWNRYVGNPLGAPWCAAFASSMTAHSKIGLATKFITQTSIKADDVLKGVKVPSGSIAIWRKGNGIFGHAEIVIKWDRFSGQTIGGNTSVSGSQSNGDGVYRKTRRIEPFSYFRIVYFTK